MLKSEYTIDGRQFHVERVGKGWTGRFVDDPERRFVGRLKMDGRVARVARRERR